MQNFLAKKWENILKEFDEIEKLLIERPYCIESECDEIVSTEGHEFSDASKTTYAASFYLFNFKFNLSSGRSKVALISSKSHFISAKVQRTSNQQIKEQYYSKKRVTRNIAVNQAFKFSSASATENL